MIQENIEVVNNIVKLTFAFPFPNIPIAKILINLIAMPLKNIGYTLKYGIVLMTEEEKAKFMKMETEVWKA